MSTLNSREFLKHLLFGIAGSATVLGFLFYATSNSSESFSPQSIFDTLSNSSITLFAIYILLAVIGIVVRAYRYQILISAAGEPGDSTPPMKSMIWITAVRGMVVDLLPARLGELVYVALLKRFGGTRITSGLSSLVFAMVLDIAVLAPLAVVLILLIGFPNNAPLKVALIAIFVVTSFYIGVRFILPHIHNFVKTHTSGHSGLVGKISGFITGLMAAAESTIRAGIFFKVVLLTVIVRALKYVGLLILFHSVASASFPELDFIKPFETLAAMIASEMTAALPIPTLMSFGAWEVGGMTFMAFLGAPPQSSLITLIAVHILTQSVDYGIGLFALLTLFLNQASHIKQTKGFRKPPIIPVTVALVSLAGTYLAWAQYNDSNREYSDNNQMVSKIDPHQLPQWLKDTEGKIVWASNRMGNHNIMMMTLPEMTVRALTVHPHTETHPRISPDGNKVIFSRSHELWQSWRIQKPWDVWLKDLETNKETRVAKHGMSASWSEDGKKIYFYRHPGEIWQYDLASKKESVLYKKNQPGMPNQELFWPSINSKGELAVAFRDLGRPTNIIVDQDGNRTDVAPGCMLTWTPSGEQAFFISSKDGGKHKNQINLYDPDTGSISRLLDLPGDLSHEYFPKLDHSEKFLIFSASDGGHEPDIEDYEIFIWKTNQKPEDAVRLTFDKGNDSWPDIYLK